MVSAKHTVVSSLLLLVASGADARSVHHPKRQLPGGATGVKTITTPSNVQIRYKELSAQGICDTTPGVRSFAGYVDVSLDVHTYFWFFESRHSPSEAPVTV